VAPLQVRPVRPDEYRASGRLVLAAYSTLPGEVMSGGYEIELTDVARRAVEAEVLVAIDGSALVGCVTFVPDRANPWAEELEDGEAAIRMLAVDPQTQGRGTGRVLVDACVERARTLGRQAVFLHTTEWMTAAHRLYARAGFERVPERDWLPVPEVALMAYRLAL
jgi:ribosomal protein S18 acetylase RimI-like enzyme